MRERGRKGAAVAQALGAAVDLALLPEFSIGVAGGCPGDQLLSVLRLNPWLASAGIGGALAGTKFWKDKDLN